MYADITEKIRFFKDKSPSFLSQNLPLLKSINYPQNDIVYKEDDPSEEVYFILKGQVKFQSSHGYTFNVYKQGALFGDHDIVSNTQRDATSVAMLDCQLLVMQRFDFKKMLNDFPQEAIEIIKIGKRKSQRHKQLKKKVIEKQKQSKKKKKGRKKDNKLKKDRSTKKAQSPKSPKSSTQKLRKIKAQNSKMKKKKSSKRMMKAKQSKQDLGNKDDDEEETKEIQLFGKKDTEENKSPMNGIKTAFNKAITIHKNFGKSKPTVPVE